MTAARTGARLTPNSPIPKKLYFKIGEVSQLVGVRAHVLRYWEKEISSIRPTKSASNQRRYRRRDVELFREIRRLLYEERYTLAGARKRLMSSSRETRESEASGGLEAQETDPARAPDEDESVPLRNGSHENTESKPEAHAVHAARLAEGTTEEARSSGAAVSTEAGESSPSAAPSVVAPREGSTAQLGNGLDVEVGNRAKLERGGVDLQSRPQLPFSFGPEHDRLERVRDGLRELIRLADGAGPE